jgi:hypothetical protein
MCSTTTESIFADQYSVYVPVLNADVGTKKSFSQGKTDFLHWDNDFTQYTTASLLGGYILSQLPEANRPAFIRTFLEDTYTEDPSPTNYVGDGSQSTTNDRSSVEDLILTLQDSDVGFSTTSAGTGWVPASIGGADSAFATDWAIVMKGFVSALTGKNAAYNQYLKDVTSAGNKANVPAPSIPLAAAATNSVSLKASAFLVGKTKVASTASVILGDASTTGTDAYVIVWNGLIPAPATIAADANNLPAGTATFGANVLLKPETSAPESRSLIDYGFRFNRTNSRPAATTSAATFRPGASAPASGRTTDIAGVGDSSNPAITGGGNLACVYLAY